MGIYDFTNEIVRPSDIDPKVNYTPFFPIIFEVGPKDGKSREFLHNLKISATQNEKVYFIRVWKRIISIEIYLIKIFICIGKPQKSSSANGLAIKTLLDFYY